MRGSSRHRSDRALSDGLMGVILLVQVNRLASRSEAVLTYP